MRPTSPIEPSAIQSIPSEVPDFSSNTGSLDGFDEAGPKSGLTRKFCYERLPPPPKSPHVFSYEPYQNTCCGVPSHYHRTARRSCEDPSGYTKEDGYHPVMPGEIFTISNDVSGFNHRFQVLLKLGNGTFSTVWLAEAQQLESHDPLIVGLPRYVALKVWAADAKNCQTDDTILSMLMRRMKYGARGSELVVKFYGAFKVIGPNGTPHVVHVMEPTGPPLRAISEDPYSVLFPRTTLPEIRMYLVRQIAEALEFIHSCGIVHGDLHLGNVVFALPSLELLEPEEVRQLLGYPKEVNWDWFDTEQHLNSIDWDDPRMPKEFYVAPDTKTVIGVCTCALGNPPEDPENLMLDDIKLLQNTFPEIRILDFCESFIYTDSAATAIHSSASSTPEDYEKLQVPGIPIWMASPEVLAHYIFRNPISIQYPLPPLPHVFNFPMTSALDVWSLATLTYSILCEWPERPLSEDEHSIWKRGHGVLPQCFLVGWNDLPPWRTMAGTLLSVLDRLPAREWEEGKTERALGVLFEMMGIATWEETVRCFARNGGIWWGGEDEEYGFEG